MGPSRKHEHERSDDDVEDANGAASFVGDFFGAIKRNPKGALALAVLLWPALHDMGVLPGLRDRPTPAATVTLTEDQVRHISHEVARDATAPLVVQITDLSKNVDIVLRRYERQSSIGEEADSDVRISGRQQP